MGIADTIKALALLAQWVSPGQRHPMRRIETNHDSAPRHKPNGAFGRCKGPFSDLPALRPAQMRAMAAGGK